MAITRGVSDSLESCELTHQEPQPIDVGIARAQHMRYERCLADLGCLVRSLPSEPDLPDSVFVEDTAVVVDELAVLTRPGAVSRRPELPAIAAVLGGYRRLERIVEPGTLDGGDVLVVGRAVYVGLSGRTNREGVRQLTAALKPAGYVVSGIPVEACLHLKSAVGRVAPDVLLVNGRWVDTESFDDVRLIEVDPAEPGAAGALLVGETVVYPARFERTLERLDRAGISTVALELSELAKAEGGVTCCSLVFTA